MREIVLDTETTGLYPKKGDKIIEIGCVELVDLVPTGKEFHCYVHPQRDIPAVVTEITGLTEEFLKDFPPFSAIASEFLDFIQDSQLVIHNASFDIAFLNEELKALSLPALPFSQALDTLTLARQKFPGQTASLDALMKKFHIVVPREKHGALLDAKILTLVYFELIEARQKQLGLGVENKAKDGADPIEGAGSPQAPFPRRSFPPSEAELQVFQKMLKGWPDSLWNAKETSATSF
ncbi:DNA polymerase III subunit epsilon [Alphaproteobacteria bacterium]|nr:DNA polymerase III subunit epsilon [Alphaproteobacteria bacterium]GHS95772.1 DNA polymerase III subunit epsilon [Alphaproteobacteria bacterium]